MYAGDGSGDEDEAAEEAKAAREAAVQRILDASQACSMSGCCAHRSALQTYHPPLHCSAHCHSSCLALEVYITCIPSSALSPCPSQHFELASLLTWQDLEPEAIMDGFSQEALALLSRGATTAAAAASVQPSRLGLFGSEITNMAAGGVSLQLDAEQRW